MQSPVIVDFCLFPLFQSIVFDVPEFPLSYSASNVMQSFTSKSPLKTKSPVANVPDVI